VKEWAEPIESISQHYRHRARFQVSKKGDIGFFNVKGNRIVEIEHCSIVQSEINDALALVRDGAPLDGVKQLEIVIDDSAQLGLNVTEGSGDAKVAVAQWAEQQGWLATAAMSYQAEGAQTLALPGGFTQVNRSVNKLMLEQAKKWLSVSAADRLLDLFCGNGNISLAFSRDVQAILGLEANGQAIQLANQSPSKSQNSQFLEENLFTKPFKDMPEVVKFEPTCVILDPPRAGAELVVNNLNTLPSVQKILYISCDPATFSRDIAVLVKEKWHLRKVGVMDMFPHTRHIESMALLEKKKTGHHSL
jgi:23S rRNA (uracil1939-C5)-methyltransferase